MLQVFSVVEKNPTITIAHDLIIIVREENN